jgi:alpha-L-rhamnosidase
MMKNVLSAILLISLKACITGCVHDLLQVKNLQCENMINPVGIEIITPRFSWTTESNRRDQAQSVYHILVSDNKENLKKNKGNIWDSEKVVSNQSVLVNYKGLALESAKKYYWKVKIWNQEGVGSDWSEPATWQMGLLSPEDWRGARWIGFRELPDSLRLIPGLTSDDRKIGNRVLKRSVIPCFRREFEVTKEIERATLYISGPGQYEAVINGDKVGSGFLTPGWTNYDKSVFYNSYDITTLLKKGPNAIGIIIGNGFYYINRERYTKLVTAFGEPSLICQLRLTYSDGTVETIITDQKWKCTPSPVTFSSIYGGEDYNALIEQEGWDKPGFDDSSWKNALLIKPPAGHLLAEQDYPVSIMEIIEAKKIKALSAGGFLYDFGQNASGIIGLKIKGNKGQQIKLIPAELITKDYVANQKASGDPYYFSYTLKGSGVETWKPRFTYYGFRYVQVEGAVPDTCKPDSDLPRIIDLKMLHTRNSSPPAGSFACSYDLFNRTNELIRWAIKSNLQSVLTDCPHREKLGWLECTYLMGEAIHFNFDLYHLFSKQIHDMTEAQTEEGLVPDFAPEYKHSSGGFRDSPEWGSASVILPWLLYKWYGDISVMEKAWPMMVHYADYLKSKSDHYIISYGLGDWFDLGPTEPGPSQLTPVPLTATAIYYYDLVLLSKMAGILQKDPEKEYYSSLALEVKSAFNKRFYNPETGVYSTGSQTAMAMPWCVGLVSDEDKDKVIHALADSIIANGKPLTAGDIGFHFLVKALSESGRYQLLFDMNARDDIPGYGFQLKKGATALTESWAALPIVSNNHLMLGHLMEWFYSGLGGISQTENSTGYKEIVIKPQMADDIRFVNTTFRSPYGEIKSYWDKKPEITNINIEIPFNTTAIISIPVTPKSIITESGRALSNIREVKFLSEQSGEKIFQIGSGKYLFAVKN